MAPTPSVNTCALLNCFRTTTTRNSRPPSSCCSPDNFADAKAAGEKLLAKSPGNVEAQIVIANALAGLKDFESAVDAFEDAAQLDPNRATTYSELGAAQVLKGDRVAAEAAFRKAVEINPKSRLGLGRVSPTSCGRKGDAGRSRTADQAGGRRRAQEHRRQSRAGDVLSGQEQGRRSGALSEDRSGQFRSTRSRSSRWPNITSVSNAPDDARADCDAVSQG